MRAMLEPSGSCSSAQCCMGESGRAEAYLSARLRSHQAAGVSPACHLSQQCSAKSSRQRLRACIQRQPGWSIREGADCSIMQGTLAGASRSRAGRRLVAGCECSGLGTIFRGPAAGSPGSSSSNSSSSSKVKQHLPQQRSVATRAAVALAVAPPAATAVPALGIASLSLQQIFAVGLGYAVLLGSLFRSVPQIIKIIRAGSAEGLSLTSNVVELCCYTVVIAYNLAQGYAFNTFGEVVACWVQDVVIVGLIFHYSRLPLWAVVTATSAFTAACWVLLSPWFPVQLLASLQAANIATMALGSRLPQILLNLRRGNAGVLSVTTCALNVMGNAARTFTTLVLTGDMLLLGGVLTQGCLNSVLLWQSVTSARQRRKQAPVAPAAAALAGAAGNTSNTGSRGISSGNSSGDGAPAPAPVITPSGPAMAPQPAM